MSLIGDIANLAPTVGNIGGSILGGLGGALTGVGGGALVPVADLTGAPELAGGVAGERIGQTAGGAGGQALGQWVKNALTGQKTTIAGEAGAAGEGAISSLGGNLVAGGLSKGAEFASNALKSELDKRAANIATASAEAAMKPAEGSIAAQGNGLGEGGLNLISRLGQNLGLFDNTQYGGTALTKAGGLGSGGLAVNEAGDIGAYTEATRQILKEAGQVPAVTQAGDPLHKAAESAFESAGVPVTSKKAITNSAYVPQAAVEADKDAASVVNDIFNKTVSPESPALTKGTTGIQITPSVYTLVKPNTIGAQDLYDTVQNISKRIEALPPRELATEADNIKRQGLQNVKDLLITHLENHTNVDAAVNNFKVSPEMEAQLLKDSGGNKKLVDYIINGDGGETSTGLNGATTFREHNANQVPLVQMSKIGQEITKGTNKLLPSTVEANAEQAIAGAGSPNFPNFINQISQFHPVLGAAAKVAGLGLSTPVISPLQKVLGKAGSSKALDLFNRIGVMGAAGGTESALGGQGTNAITAAPLPTSPTGGGMGAQTTGQGGGMNQLQQAYQQELLDQQTLMTEQQKAPLALSGALSGAISGLGSNIANLAPQVTQQNLLGSALGGLPGAYNLAQGKGETGALGAIAGLIPGTAAYSYNQQKQADAAALGKALGIDSNSAMQLLPGLYNAQAAQQRGGILGGITGQLGGAQGAQALMPAGQ